jgi:hypothetical protein
LRQRASVAPASAPQALEVVSKPRAARRYRRSLTAARADSG